LKATNGRVALRNGEGRGLILVIETSVRRSWKMLRKLAPGV
jgi:hypothetical protein